MGRLVSVVHSRSIPVTPTGVPVSVSGCHSVLPSDNIDGLTLFAGNRRKLWEKMMQENRPILGVDPGLNTTGYGVIQWDGQRIRLLEAGVVVSRAKTLANRILDIHTGVSEVILAWKPGVLALEELYSHYQRPKTAILMGHARGAICLAAATARIDVVPYAATQIKKSLTGYGRASKDQMQRAIELELKLKEYPDPPDIADALAIALCHFYHIKASG